MNNPTQIRTTRRNYEQPDVKVTFLPNVYVRKYYKRIYELPDVNMNNPTYIRTTRRKYQQPDVTKNDENNEFAKLTYLTLS